MTWMGAFSQEHQKLWLPKDDLRDSSSWSSPPILLLRDIHSRLLAQYDCTEVCAPSQSQGNVGASPHLFETSFARDESSASNAGVAAIPSQFKVTQQVLQKWQPFRDLKQKVLGSRRQEQLSSRCQQRVVPTVEESVVRTEMTGLESQEEDSPKRVLFYKPMSWLGQIRPHRRDESWSPSLW